MELELGLALSNIDPIKKLDLNPTGNIADDHHYYSTTTTHSKILKRKRASNEDDDDSFTADVPQTLPLFIIQNHMTTNCINTDLEDNSSFNTISKNDGNDENGVIGWPPIKYCRKFSDGVGSKSSSYVKVNMEGVAIARKVDLSQHHSYETLAHTLFRMFGRCEEENLKGYKLTYQDTGGDWLLAGDEPWGNFKRSVQRLKLIKEDE